MSRQYKRKGDWLKAVDYEEVTGTPPSTSDPPDGQPPQRSQKNQKKSPTKLLEQAKEKLRICEYYKDFMRRKIAELTKEGEFQALSRDMTALNAGGQGALPDQSAYDIPLFKGQLRPYQFQGVKWLKLQDSLGSSSILADDMGLGKTVQVIAFMCDLIREGVTGPFLFVVPVSTLNNWKAEFHRFAPQLPVLFYYGEKKGRRSLARKMMTTAKFDGYRSKPLVLTTYEILLKDKSVFQRVSWRCFVVDEGHRLKNIHGIMAAVCKQMTSSCRILLTGTPLQNDLTELWSLLNFIMPSLFKDYAVFKEFFDFGSLLAANTMNDVLAHSSLVERIHQILDPFILRRLKIDVEPQLPLRKTFVVYAELSEAQLRLFRVGIKIMKRMLRKSKSKKRNTDDQQDANEALACHGNDQSNTKEDDIIESIGRDLADGNVSFMTFRHITNHPLILTTLEDAEIRTEDLIGFSGKMTVLDVLLRALKAEGGHKVLIFSQFKVVINLLCLYCERRNYGYCTLVGDMKCEERRVEMEQFDNDPEKFIFLLTTRAGNLGVNLIAADTVVLYDSDPNPQSDLQAQDRCFRIGQNKPVITYRLITRNSVDELIWTRANQKRRLEKIILESGPFTVDKVKREHLDVKKLLAVVTSHEHDASVQARTGSCVLSDETLKILLDRNPTTKEAAHLSAIEQQQ